MGWEEGRRGEPMGGEVTVGRSSDAQRERREEERYARVEGRGEERGE